MSLFKFDEMNLTEHSMIHSKRIQIKPNRHRVMFNDTRDIERGSSLAKQSAAPLQAGHVLEMQVLAAIVRDQNIKGRIIKESQIIIKVAGASVVATVLVLLLL